MYEPVAAAYYFAQRLTRAATVLVADFGGGTSDFSVVHFEPGAGQMHAKPLGHSGVEVAGDQFDYRILENAVFDQLGYRSEYRSIGKVLQIPGFYHHQLAQWSQLSVMKTPHLLRELKEFQRYSNAPNQLAHFIELIENDWGYPLYQAVSKTKALLSVQDSADFEFNGDSAASGFTLRNEIKRSDFKQWISPELKKIERAIEEALISANLQTSQIDKVFLTGGSSFVPAVRELFENHFSADKIETGEQLESIAYGLGLIAASENPAAWSVSS